jgi:YgiT-type zinc finger domain-containing protein
MATCPTCRKELHEGLTSLEFQENGLTITVTEIPALVCECGEVVIKSSVAEYVSDLVDRIVELERVHYGEEAKERLYVREVALAVAA